MYRVYTEVGGQTQEIIDTPIWRYFDYIKFLNLLEDSAITFAKPSSFKDDPHEGAYPWLTQKLMLQSNEQYLIGRNEQYLERSFVSCWHQSDLESTAMWGSYSHARQGLAVRTAPRKLLEALDEDEMTYIVGAVKYVDIENMHLNSSDISEPLFYKRRQYSHEKEFRVTVQDGIGENHRCYERLDKPALKVKIADLNYFIDRIVAAPGTEAWQIETMQKLLGRYQLTCRIDRSELDKPRLVEKDG